MRMRKLHIGGNERAEGWEVADILPGVCVDHVIDAKKMDIFPENTFAMVYASHVLEHFSYVGEILTALKEWQRILVPDGLLCVSVPDMDALAGLFVNNTELNFEERFHIMTILFGGQTDAYDFHRVGFCEEFLRRYLQLAGFSEVIRVDRFGLFNDSSCLTYKGLPISLNVIARKTMGISHTG